MDFLSMNTLGYPILSILVFLPLAGAVIVPLLPGENSVRVWTLSRIRSSQRCALPHPAGVDALAYLPDGKTLVTAAADGRVRVWDTAGIKPVVRTEFAGAAKVLVVASAEMLVGTADGSVVTNWDPRSGKLLATWDVPGGAGTGLAQGGLGIAARVGVLAGEIGLRTGLAGAFCCGSDCCDVMRAARCFCASRYFAERHAELHRRCFPVSGFFLQTGHSFSISSQ